MKPRNFKQAAQASLDERWYPISQAKSIGEMREIFGGTMCALCQLQLSKVSKGCNRCPLRPCAEYDEWYEGTCENDFPKAHQAALKLVKRLEKIAGTKGGQNVEQHNI